MASELGCSELGLRGQGGMVVLVLCAAPPSASKECELAVGCCTTG